MQIGVRSTARCADIARVQLHERNPDRRDGLRCLDSERICRVTRLAEKVGNRDVQSRRERDHGAAPLDPAYTRLDLTHVSLAEARKPGKRRL